MILILNKNLLRSRDNVSLFYWWCWILNDDYLEWANDFALGYEKGQYSCLKMDYQNLSSHTL